MGTFIEFCLFSFNLSLFELFVQLLDLLPKLVDVLVAKELGEGIASRVPAHEGPAGRAEVDDEFSQREQQGLKGRLGRFR